jgi:hypothetical protein
MTETQETKNGEQTLLCRTDGADTVPSAVTHQSSSITNQPRRQRSVAPPFILKTLTTLDA